MTIVTLTTDFGLEDNFVGVMKGVILAAAPEARLVDLVHSLPRGDVAAGAFALYTAHGYFPESTVHLAVVDPGVGADRAVLSVRAGGRIFVAPDNGLLSYILDDHSDFEARSIENPDFMLPAISRTFHGRDIMAPAAARLAVGAPFEDSGPAAPSPLRLPPLAPKEDPGGWTGRVVYVDRFGNLITNIPNRLFEDEPGLVLTAGPLVLSGLSSSYSDAPPGGCLALPGSSGFVEIARNQGRAEEPPHLAAGAPVGVQRG